MEILTFFATFVDINQPEFTSVVNVKFKNPKKNDCQLQILVHSTFKFEAQEKKVL